MHGADVDIGVTGYLAHRADKPGSVLVVAEEEIAAGGHDIHPEVVDPARYAIRRALPCPAPMVVPALVVTSTVMRLA